MEVILDWMTLFLHSDGRLTSYLSSLYSTTETLHSRLSSLFGRISAHPDLGSIALLLLILLLSVKLLDMLRRAVMFWLRLAFRLLFWGAIISAAFYIWLKGVDGALRDVGYWSGVWSGELSYWQRQANAAMAFHEQRLRDGHAESQWT